MKTESPKFKVGQLWRARNGVEHRICNIDDDEEETFVVEAETGLCWTREGRCRKLGEHPSDLVQLIEDVPEPDLVNKPPHYQGDGIECIDAIQAALTPEEFRGYCKGNALKYIWREKHKGGEQDLHKAAWYLNRITGTKP